MRLLALLGAACCATAVLAQQQPQGAKPPATKPAAAQAPQAGKVFRCIDARGATIYTDKPELNCKNVRIDAPPPGQTLKASKPPPPPRKVARAAPEPRNQAAHCRSMNKALADLESGKMGGLNGAAMAQRRVAVEKSQAADCGNAMRDD